jgi:hypothetical protein
MIPVEWSFTRDSGGFGILLFVCMVEAFISSVRWFHIRK